MMNDEDGDLEYWKKELLNTHSVQHSQLYISISPPANQVTARINRIKLCKKKIAELEKIDDRT